MKKVVTLIIGLLLLGGLIVALIFVQKSELNEFDENGLYKNASINKMYSKVEMQPGVKVRMKTVYYADISYFVKDSDTRTGVKPVKETEEHKTFDQILEDIGNIKVDIGDYTSNQLSLSKRQFDAHQGKKHIEILYLKDEPNKIILKSLLD